jgi:hypothetical protein
MKNSYFLCLQYQDDPIRWDPSSPQDRTVHERYFGGVFTALEQHLREDGLTIYLTWDLETLPSYGSDVIAVVMGDEWARIPLYSHAVRATFKCYGTSLALGGNPFTYPSRINVLAAAKYVRDQIHRMPGIWSRIRAGLRHGSWSSLPPIFPLPLGYANQVELPLKNIFDRKYDIQFAGSISHGDDHKEGLKRWLSSPKVEARKRMLHHLTAYQDANPSVECDIFITDGFGPHAVEWGPGHFQKMRDAEEYSSTLMDTKICLVPRGTSLETFRFFEGLRAGCVMITEGLPDRWFYDGAPVHTVNDWSELGEVLDRLLHDPDRLYRLHRAARTWWNEKCSEEAVGRYMADRLHSIETSAVPDEDAPRPRSSPTPEPASIETSVSG